MKLAARVLVAAGLVLLLAGFGNGTYAIGAGPGKVPSGTYTAPGGPKCSWARLGLRSKVIAQGVGRRPLRLAIPTTDVAFRTSGCGDWKVAAGTAATCTVYVSLPPDLPQGPFSSIPTGQANFRSNQPRRPAVFWLAHNGYITESAFVTTDARGWSGPMDFGITEPAGTLFTAGVTFDLKAFGRGGGSVPPPALCQRAVQRD